MNNVGTNMYSGYTFIIQACTCMYCVCSDFLGLNPWKRIFAHIKWRTSGTHYAPAQLWLPFHTPKGSQGAINSVSLKYLIQLCRCPTRARLCPLIGFVGKFQFILQVLLANQLCQFGWQPTQDRMCSPIYVLQPLWSGLMCIQQGQGGCRIVRKRSLLGLG